MFAMAMNTTVYTNTGRRDPPGTMEEEEEEEDDDYENTAPPYKSLPPKPGSVAPPRPPRPGKNAGNPPLPQKPAKITALGLPTVCSLDLPAVRPSHQSGVAPEPHVQPPVPRAPSPSAVPPRGTPVPWIQQKSWGCGCAQEERLLVLLGLLGVTSLLLSSISLGMTLTKYQEVVEKLETLALRQTAWQANVTGMAGLAGLRKDIDRVRADTNRSLVELRGLLDCTRVTCPDGWLPFEDKCYYFSPVTKSWDEARKFCQENYSHLVIISSFAEHNFVTKAHGSPRVYWLGLTDKAREGDWRWLDGSPVTLSFWDPQEPNNMNGEDCASMNKGGTWNDLSCAKTTYWICERKCSC